MSKNRELAKAVGDQSAHDSPAGNANVAYLDRLWEALDVQDTTAMSAVGRGAIVESGSNSNGHYVRWENGEQVCSGQTFDESVSTGEDTSGEWGRSVRFSFDYPAVFVRRPQGVGLTGNRASGTNEIFTVTRTNISSDDNEESLGYVYLGDPSASTDRGITYVAWGFWK